MRRSTSTPAARWITRRDRGAPAAATKRETPYRPRGDRSPPRRRRVRIRRRAGTGARGGTRSGWEDHARSHAPAAPAAAGAGDGDRHRTQRVMFKNRQISIDSSLAMGGYATSRATSAAANDPEWLRLGQAAKFLGVAQSTMRK